MSREKLVRARELIEQKRFAEARALLQTVDHPVARKWLARLDEIDPDVSVASEGPVVRKPRAAATRPAEKPKTRGARTALMVALSGIIGFAIGLIVGMALGGADDGISATDLTRQYIIDINSTTLAEQETATERALSGPSDFELTATAIVNQNATTVAGIEATNAALTNVPTQVEATATETVSDLPAGDAGPATEDEDQPPFDTSGSVPGEGDTFDFGDDGPPIDDTAPDATAAAPTTGATQTP